MPKTKGTKKKAPKKAKEPKKEKEVKKEAPQEKEVPQDDEDVVDGEVREIITKSEDEAVFEAMDYADEEQVLAELQGRAGAIEHYVYSFRDKDGREITGLSLSGTREAARALALASLANPTLAQPTVPDPPVITDETPEHIRVQATALDQRTGFRWHGFVEQEKYYLDKKTGENKRRRFAYVIATSKAQRNALRGLLPEHWIIDMIKTYIEQGKVKKLDEEQQPSVFTLPKGKYQGSTIAEVQEQDPEYLQWASKNWEDRAGMLIRQFLEQSRTADAAIVSDDGEYVTIKSGKKIDANKKISSAWFDKLRKMVKEAEMHGAHLKNHLNKHYGVESIAHLTFGQAVPFAQYLIDKVEKGKGEPEEPDTESALDESEEHKPYAMPEGILALAGEIEREDFDFETFVVEHIAPHMAIDKSVEALLFQFLQRLSELDEGEDMEPVVKLFDKGIAQLAEVE